MSRKWYPTWIIVSFFVILLLLVNWVHAATQQTEIVQVVAVGEPVPEQQNQPLAVDEITAEMVLNPSDDAPVVEGQAAATHPTDDYLVAGLDDGSLYANGRLRSYLKFDLSSIPADSMIISATFRIKHAGGRDYPGESRTVSFYRVTGSWAESTITWNNRPGYSEFIASCASTYDDVSWCESDVTQLVNNWVNGSTANHGLVAIGPENVSGIYRLFFAREYVGSAELVIRYLPTPPPVLDVWPATVYTQASQHALTPPASFNVGNVTYDSLAWTATKVGTASWLTIDTSSGTVMPNSPDAVPLSIDASGLSPGVYTAQIRVSSSTPQVVGSPLTATVTLEVKDLPNAVYLPQIVKSSASTTPADNLDVYALVVGVAEYQGIPTSVNSVTAPDVWPEPLYYTDDDAIDVAALLAAAGFDTTRLLNSNATKSDMLDGIAQARQKITSGTNCALSVENCIVPNTMFIFYYSGHGAQTLDLNGDEADGLDELIAPHDILPVVNGFENVITDDELKTLLDSVGAEYTVVIIDSCFSGGMMSTSMAERLPDELTPRVWVRDWPENSLNSIEADLADIDAPNRLVITGGTGDQLTYESPALGNGVFTYFFLQGLEDALHDVNENGRVSAEEAYWFTKDAVDDWIYPLANEHQNPAIDDQVHGQVDVTWMP